MAFNDKHHIVPSTGRADLCHAVVGQCQFGGLNHHFGYPSDAHANFDRRTRTFEDWNARSVMPQEEGWVTEHVFDPQRPETYKNHLVWLDNRIPAGTRMVIENGWVFNKLSFSHFWELIEGVESVGGIKKGMPLNHYQFLGALKDFGGRLEYTDGVSPMVIDWRLP